MNRLLIVATFVLCATQLQAQQFTSSDPVIRRIWSEGMDHSQTYPLAQTLMDSIGSRLTGSPSIKAGNDWLVAKYTSWGISAHNEQYGTWSGWRRGPTHIDLLAPRVRSLEGTMLAWSPGTKGPVDGSVVILPDVADPAAFAAWLPQARGKFVLTLILEPTCRPDANWKEFATPESFARMQADRDSTRRAWTQRIQKTGSTARELPRRLEDAGVKGIITSLWSQGWGVTKVFNARTTTVPTVELSCEDYGLVYRLAEHNQGPMVRVNATSDALGEVPVFNTVAEIKGSTKPNEYVLLSSHFDSWDGGSGATDNGTGTIMMLEAMRILKTVYPNPKRTIIAGHWSGEEEGLIGSRSFAADHPEVVKGLQVSFNQDNGTGRVSNISMQGLLGAGEHFASWLSRVPLEITRNIQLQLPGSPGSGGSDYASFICYGAPSFSLGGTSWDYSLYTWHTGRDTFDKIVFDDLRNNATLAAMLAYLASEDPTTVPREQRIFTEAPAAAAAGPSARPGRPVVSAWPTCQTPPRTSAQNTR